MNINKITKHYFLPTYWPPLWLYIMVTSGRCYIPWAIHYFTQHSDVSFSNHTQSITNHVFLYLFWLAWSAETSTCGSSSRGRITFPSYWSFKYSNWPRLSRQYIASFQHYVNFDCLNYSAFKLISLFIW